MNTDVSCFLNILGAFVRGEAATLPQGTDIQALLRVAQRANLSGLLGYMLLPHAERLSAEDAVRLQSHFFKTVGLFANRNEACETLQRQLQAADIPFAFVKGAAISRVYPARELRTFGDVDVYVPPAHRARLEALFADETVTHTDDGQLCVSRPPLFIEFHFSLTADAVNPRVADYLAQADQHLCEWANAPATDPLFHTVYLLSHQLRHWQNDNPGIRTYLDLAVLAAGGHIPPQLGDTLRTLGLYTYAAKTFSLIEQWFHVPSPLEPVTFTAENTAYITDYLFRAGQFAAEHNPRAGQVAAQMPHSRFPRLTAAWQAVFPPADHLRRDPRFEALARRCLPLAYLSRIFRGVFCRKDHVWASAKAVATASADAAARARIQEILQTEGEFQ